MRGEEYLTKPQQYALVYNQGSSWASDWLVMKALPNGLTLSRYGFSVSRRVGKAVVRNRVKRRLREILRAAPLKAGWDIIFIARQSAAEADYAGLKSIAERLLSRGGLLAINSEPGRPAEVNASGG
jgi:ribonuclease P protein component